jgi:hypothetical protein
METTAMIRASSSAALVLMLAALPAAPDAQAGNVSLNAHGGSLGAGLGAGYAFDDHWAARVGFNRYSSGSYEWSEGDLDYDAELDLDTVHALLDWHPFGGDFRVTGGAMANDNRVDGGADVERGDQIGNARAVNDGRIGAEVDFRSTAPYAGIGWGSRAGAGLSFNFDLGVMFQGEPDFELREEENVVGVSESDLEEEERKLEDEYESYDLYPVVQLGLIYRF